MTAPNTQLTIDLNSVAYISFYYLSQYGSVRRTKPKLPSVRGVYFKPDELAPAHIKFPNETMMNRAKRLNCLDEWKPICIYQFRNNHSMRFSGEQAIQRKNQYNKHIFNCK